MRTVRAYERAIPQRMVRTGFLIALFALPGLQASGQRSGVGLKAGGLMSSLPSKAAAYQPLPGAIGGLYVPVRVGDNMQLQAEVLLAMLGARHRSSDAGAMDVRIKYLHLPLTMKLYLDHGFHVQAGVQLGKRLQALHRGPLGDTDASALYRMYDLGVVGGLGVDFPRSVTIALRYHEGVGPILEDGQALALRNRSLQLTVGLMVVRLDGHAVRRRR